MAGERRGNGKGAAWAWNAMCESAFSVTGSTFNLAEATAVKTSEVKVGLDVAPSSRRVTAEVSKDGSASERPATARTLPQRRSQHEDPKSSASIAVTTSNLARPGLVASRFEVRRHSDSCNVNFINMYCQALPVLLT